MPRTQKDRLWAAVNAARSAPALSSVLSSCNAAGRAKFAKRLLDQAWTGQNFRRLRSTIPTAWKGDQLTTLVEMSHYLLPRATWAVPRASREAWVRREVAFTLLALAQHTFGRFAARELREQFVAEGVKYRPRRKASPAQRAALKARQFKKTEAVLDRALAQLGKASKAVAVAKLAVTTGRRRITFTDE